MTRASLFLALALAACGATPEPPAPVEEAPPADPAPATEAVAPTEAPVPEADGVYFLNLEDGAHISNPVRVVMGVRGMTVHPAGQVLEGTGHHHVLIDLEPIAAGTVIPSTPQHVHFGAGQTEAELELPPGAHTLTLQFANGMHESYGPDWSRTITVHLPVPEGPE